MKGTKTLTTLASLALVLTLGGCNDADAYVSLTHSVDEIFDYIQDVELNYHETVSYNCYQTPYFDSQNDFDSALSEGRAEYEFSWGFKTDAYYTEDAIIFFYDYDVEEDNGYDDVEVYLNNYEDGVLEVYYLLSETGELEDSFLGLYDTYGLNDYEPKTWQQGFYSIADLVDDRDTYLQVYSEGESETSGAYTRYDVTPEAYEGLYYCLFHDNYAGSYFCDEGYFAMMMEEYSDIADMWHEYGYEGYDLNWECAQNAYWYDDDVWQVVFKDVGDYYYWTHTEGQGRFHTTQYLGLYTQMVANVTEVGQAHVPQDVVSQLEGIYRDVSVTD